MTEESRRKNVAIEVARGAESLESAEILLAAGKLADAVSRAYYGGFIMRGRSCSRWARSP